MTQLLQNLAHTISMYLLISYCIYIAYIVPKCGWRRCRLGEGQVAARSQNGKHDWDPTIWARCQQREFPRSLPHLKFSGGHLIAMHKFTKTRAFVSCVAMHYIYTLNNYSLWYAQQFLECAHPHIIRNCWRDAESWKCKPWREVKSQCLEPINEHTRLRREPESEWDWWPLQVVPPQSRFLQFFYLLNRCWRSGWKCPSVGLISFNYISTISGWKE